MPIDAVAVERLMKRCQIGVGGRNALDDAHDIMAECYGTLGALLAERDTLRAAVRQYLVDNDPEEFGCACEPERQCGQCVAYERQRVLRNVVDREA